MASKLEKKLMNITICVGLPTRNRPILLRRALASLSSQTRPPDEILIGDNSDNSETLNVYNEWQDILPNLRYTPAGANINALSNFMRLVKESSTTHFMWLADDDVLDPHLIEKATDFLSQRQSTKYLCWGYSVHNYVTGTTELPASLPKISCSCSNFENTRLFLEQPTSSLIYGLYERNALINSSINYWNQSNASFDWMDVASIMSMLLEYESHLIPETLVIFGIDKIVRRPKYAAGKRSKRYNPLPWLVYGTMLILRSPRLSILERIALLQRFIYAWRNTSKVANNAP